MIPIRVAVVDDEAPVRVALRRLLRLERYEVVLFASGEDFLDSLDSRCVDCALVDLHMLGLTGLQVRAKLTDAGQTFPVIFITASDDINDLRSGFEASGFEVLRKPFGKAELLASLKTALDRSPRRD